jgi:hypothetical protein
MYSFRNNGFRGKSIVGLNFKDNKIKISWVGPILIQTNIVLLLTFSVLFYGIALLYSFPSNASLYISAT